MAVPSWFDEGYYLASKATVLNQQSYEGRSDWTASDVYNVFTAYGLTAYDHYTQYGDVEGLNPNAYFDQEYYLQEKAQQLNSAAYEGRTDWTSAEVRQSFSSANLTAYQHFSLYGSKEGLDPCASFSTQNYLQQKANTLNQQGQASQWSAASVLDAFADAGLDPVSHFMLYGTSEAISPASGTNYSLTAVYGLYGGIASGLTQLNLDGIVGDTVNVTLDENNTATVTCSSPSDISSVGTNSLVFAIDAGGISGAGAELTGNANPNYLVGTSYDDTIVGGMGVDWMTGNSGGDKFVFHFGNTTQDSDSNIGQEVAGFNINVSDCIVDFQCGVDTISILTDSNESVAPTTVYYGGNVDATVDLEAFAGTITNNDGAVTYYDLSSLDQNQAFYRDMLSSALSDKNGLLEGTSSLSANEAMVWNLQITTTNTGEFSLSNENSLMVAVNDSTEIFDAKDIVIQCEDAMLTDSYDPTTGIIADCSLFV